MAQLTARPAPWVSCGRNVGTNTGQVMGKPPTGKTIDVPAFGMLRFKDGRAIEWWGVIDTMSMTQQFGLLG
jgi:predicted ester cyclase